ncbi:13144_t:CDS:2, partial [Acaulospora morrowiae]
MKTFDIVELLSIPIIRPKETKLIIVTGAIAVGKTTFARDLLDHLINQGYHATLRVEVARTLEDELRLYQGDSEKYAFFFQYAMIQAYYKEMEEIKKLKNYDYIILDRSHLDTIPFTNVMIPDGDGEVLMVLEDKLSKIKFPFDVAKVIYLKPSCDKMLERYRIRELDECVKESGVDVGYDDDYLIAIYEQYDLCMENMYSSYMKVISHPVIHSPGWEKKCIKMEMITRENLLIGDCDYDGVQFHFLPIDVDESTLYETGDYVLRLHGILTNGRRMRIDVCGIKPFFDILINGVDVDEMLSEIKCESYEIIQAKPINLFCENTKEFVRFYFKNSGIRSKQLKMVKDRYVTYSNDLTFHYRKVLRECKIDVTRWKMIESSELVYGNDQYRKVLKVHRDHIINSQNPPRRDRIMILCWDIETYSSREGGEVPKPEYDEDEVFMICMTVHWYDENEPIRKICLCTQDLNECENWIFRRSYSQEQMIMDFAYCVKLINPDVMMGFNDGGYDWPFVLKKAERLNILRDFVSTMGGTKFKGSSISDAGYNIHENNIKITAQDNVRVMYFRRLGTLMIDVMVSFRKMYPNSERNSLSHFLKMINLEGKVDLSHLVLRKYYRD